MPVEKGLQKMISKMESLTSSGYRPVSRNPPCRCWGLKARCHISAKSLGNTSLSTFDALVFSLKSLRTVLHACFIGAYTPTSSGCKTWVVLGGKAHNVDIAFTSNLQKLQAQVGVVTIQEKNDWSCSQKGGHFGNEQQFKPRTKVFFFHPATITYTELGSFWPIFIQVLYRCFPL